MSQTVNEENFRTWLDGLRSDEYDQGNGALAQIHGERVGYCCLGVGCVLADIPKQRSQVAQNYKFGDHGAAGLAPPEFLAWLGLDVIKTSKGTVRGESDIFIDWPLNLRDRQSKPLILGNSASCSGLNDSLSLSFPEIADVLEYFGIK